MSPRAEMGRHTMHTPTELVLLRGELPTSFAGARRRPDVSHRPASAGPTLPHATSATSASMQQRLVLSPRAETAAPPPAMRPARAASAAPTRPQQQSNPRNLLRPKSSTAQRKLLQTTRDSHDALGAVGDPTERGNSNNNQDDTKLAPRPPAARLHAPPSQLQDVGGSSKRFKMAAVVIGMTAKLDLRPEAAPLTPEANHDDSTALRERMRSRVAPKHTPREQLRAFLEAPSNTANDTFYYAVPAHQLSPFARYDPYTLVPVPFHTVYANHAHVTTPEPLQFTSDDRIIDTHIKCDFYVIHDTGLLFYCKANATVEYQSKAEWDRECRVFAAVSNIALFQKYRGLKALVCWKRYYRRHKFATAQDAIQNKLYFCNPVLYATMVHIRNKLLPFTDLTLFEPSNNSVRAPSAFVHTHRRRVIEIATRVTDLANGLRDLLATIAREYLSQYSTTESVITHAETCFTSRKSTVFHVDQLKRTSGHDATKRHDSPPKKRRHRLQSLVSGTAVDIDMNAIRAELQRNRFRYQVNEAKRTHAPAVDQVKWSIAAVKRARCLELAHFITRVDFMLLDMYQDMVVRSAHHLVTVLAIASGAKGPSLLLSKEAYIKAYRRFDTFGTESMNTAQLTRLLQFVFDGKLQGDALHHRVAALDEFSHGLDILLDQERMLAIDPDLMSVYESSQKVDVLRPEPLFEVDLSLGGDETLAFTPALCELGQSITATLNGFFDVCAHVTRLVHCPVLLPYLTFAYEVRSTEVGAMPLDEKEVTRVPSLLHERASQDAAFLLVASQIDEIVKDATCAAHAYAKCFESLRTSHVGNNGIDFDLVATQHRHGMYPLALMQTDIERFQHNQAKLDDLVTRQDIQLIRVHTLGLKAQLVPSPGRCLHEYARVLPILAETNCKDLLSYIEIASTKIQRPASRTLDAFVAYLLNLHEVTEELLTKDHEAAQITSYFDVLHFAGFAVPDHTQAAYDLCGPELSTLKANATTCLARRDTDIRDYAGLLTQTIEHLDANIEYLATDARSDQVCDGAMDAEKALAFAKHLQEAAQDQERKAKRLVYMRGLFNSFLPNVLPETSLFASLPPLLHDLSLKHDVWALVTETEETLARWGPSALHDLPINEMNLLLEQLTDILGRMVEKYATLPLTRRLRKLQSSIAHVAPIVRDLCSDHLDDRHWQRLENKLGVKFEYEVDTRASVYTRHSEIPLSYLMSLNVETAKDTIHEVVQEAATEAAISKSLHEAIKVWETKDIPFLPRLVDHDTREILVLGNTSDVLAMLEDSDVLLQTILGSSYIRPIQSLALKWRDEVVSMTELITRLEECHRYWDHMEVVLSSEFMRAVPEQAMTYSQLEKTWKALVDKISRNPSLLRTARATGVKEQLIALNHGFGSIYKLLEGYLALKRQNFPRFYVLSDAELAELISQCRDPRQIQKYLHYVFPCIQYLEFGVDDKSQDIVAAHAPRLPYPEVITLGKNLKARGYVEQWVAAVHRRLHERVQKLVRDSIPFWLAHLDEPLTFEMLRDTALQCLLVGQDVVVCHHMTAALTHATTSTLTTMSMAHATRLATMVQSLPLVSQHASIKAATLLLQQLYYRDVIAGLSVSNGKDHLRYFIQEDSGDVFLELYDVRVPYGYTYCNPTRSTLVLSPLTARCHLALFNTLRSFQSTLVSGPMNSGKSTMVQMLSRATGRELLQTVCTPLMRPLQLEQLLTGSLLLSGTLLLRHVDGLSSSLLQYLAQLISTISNHAMAKRHFITLDDREDREVHFSIGASVMMTSSCLASAAHRPALSALLERTISLPLIPLDMQVAMHALLYSHGFEDVADAARKLASVWHELQAAIAREAPELRHVATLPAALQALRPLAQQRQSDATLEEAHGLQTTLLAYLNEHVLPTAPEVHAHMTAFIKALWFMSPPPRPVAGEPTTADASVIDLFASCLRQAYEKHQIVLTPSVQATATRVATAVAMFRTVIVTGAPKAGKTTTMHVVANALNCLQPIVHEAYPMMAAWGLATPHDTRFVRIKRVLPAALSLDRLFGTSGDGETSILKTLFHEPAEISSCHFVVPPENGPITIQNEALPPFLQELLTYRQRRWVCLDGALNGPWIESLLGMASYGSAGHLGLHQLPQATKGVVTCEPHVSLLLETVTLDHASPSLVTNVGLVHLHDDALHHLVLQGFVKGLAARPGVPRMIAETCTKYLCDAAFIDRLLECQRQGSMAYPMGPVHATQNVLALLQAMLTNHGALPFDAIFQAPSEAMLAYAAKVELAVLWSLLWGLGGALDAHTKRMLSTVLEHHFKHLEEAWQTNGANSSLYDCLLDLSSQRFHKCKDYLAAPNALVDAPLFAVYMPRAASTLVHVAAKHALRGGAPVLVCGAPDAGSSSCVVDLLQRLSAFSARGLSLLDTPCEPATEDKARLANMRLSTTLLVSSMAGRMKRRLQAAKGDPGRRDSTFWKSFVDATCTALDTGNVVATCFALTAATSSATIEGYLERCLQRERRAVLEPPPGKTMLLFLDDLHLPTAKYPSPHTTLRSILDCHHVYLGTAVEPHTIEHTLLLATAPLSVTASLTDPSLPLARLLGRFFPLVLDTMTSTDVYQLVQPLFASHFERPDVRYHVSIRQQAKTPHFRLQHLLGFLQHLVTPTPTSLLDIASLVRLWHHEAQRVFYDASPLTATVASEIDKSLTLLCDRTSTSNAAFANDAIWTYYPHGLLPGTKEPAEVHAAARAIARRQSSKSLVSPAPVSLPLPIDSLDGHVYGELVTGSDAIEADIDRLQAALAPHVPPSYALTPSAVLPLLRLCRLLGAPGRRCLYVGDAGCGKPSLVAAAAHLLGHQCLHYKGGDERWRDVVQRGVRSAGVEQCDVTLVVEHSVYMSESQFDDLMQLLLGREVPLLFSADDQDAMARQVRDDKLAHLSRKHAEQLALLVGANADPSLESKLQKQRDALLNVQHGETDDVLRQFEANVDVNLASVLPITKANGVLSGIWADILRAAQRNLRVVVVLTHDDLRRLVQRAPKLATAVPIATASVLPHPSIHAICRGHVFRAWQKYRSRVVPGEKDLEVLAAIGAMCHISASAVATCALTLRGIALFANQVFASLERLSADVGAYMERPKAYLELLAKLHAEVDHAKATEATLVATMETTVAGIAAKKAVLTTHQTSADHLRHRLREQKLEVDAHVAATNEMDHATQTDLKDALRTLDDANVAVASLDKRFITEIKSFIHPPLLVHLVLNAVCVLFNVDASWENARRLLSDVNFVSSLIGYNKDNVSDVILDKLSPFMSDPSFSKDEVVKQSVAASTMVVWISAIYEYSRVRKLVQPKLDLLAASQANLRGLVKAFTDCQAQLDAADAASTDLETKIQIDMQAKKELQERIDSARYVARQGAAVLSLLTVETAAMTASLDEMLEMEATLLVEAALTAAIVVFMPSIHREARVSLLNHWRSDVSATYRVHPTLSIVAEGTPPPWARWLFEIGIFSSRVHMTTAVALAHATSIVLITNLSTEMETLLLNVLAVDDAPYSVLHGTTKDMRTVFEACAASGTPVVVHDVTPTTIETVVDTLARTDASRKFRLVCTSRLPSAAFCGYDGLVVDAALASDAVEVMLLDDMCRENVANASRKSACSATRSLQSATLELRDGQDSVMHHLRDILATLKFTAADMDKLKDLCAHNVRIRSAMADDEAALASALNVYKSAASQRLARVGAHVFAALPTPLPLPLNGYRKLYLQLLTPEKWRSPEEWLALALDHLALSIHASEWPAFLWRLALRWHDENVPPRPASGALSAPSISPTTTTSGLRSFTQLQLDVFLPRGLANATSPHILEVLQASTVEDLLTALQVQMPMAKRRRPRPEDHDTIDVLSAFLQSANPSSIHIALLLQLLWPSPRLASFTTEFVATTLGLGKLETRLSPTVWYQKGSSRDLALYYRSIVTTALPTSRAYLALMLDVTTPMQAQHKVLHSLLQRPLLAAPEAPFTLPAFDLSWNQKLLCVESIQQLLYLDDNAPLMLTQYAWRGLYIADPERLHAYVQHYRHDTRLAGALAHDDGAPPSAVADAATLHVWHPNTTVPPTIAPYMWYMAPPPVTPFARALRDTVLQLASIPFSTRVAEALLGAPLTESARNTLGIVIWRVLCSLCFFHATLLVRHETVVGAAVDVAAPEMSDVTLCVLELIGPVLTALTRQYAQRRDDAADPFSGLDWPRLRRRLLQCVYSRKGTTNRGWGLLNGLLAEVLGPNLVSLDASRLQSRFQLPLHSFYAIFHDRQALSSAEDYVRLLCDLAATASFEWPDVRISRAPSTPSVHEMLLSTERRMQDDVVAEFTAILQCLHARVPSPLVLKLHPRNASNKPTPMRSLCKAVVRLYESDIATLTTALAALSLPHGVRYRELPPSVQSDMTLLLQDKVPRRLALRGLRVGTLSLSGYLDAIERHKAFLQTWWDEDDTEWSCPSVPSLDELLASFLLTYGVQCNRDVAQISVVVDVYAATAAIPTSRRRCESMVLTGLTLLNAAPNAALGIDPVAGHEVPVKLLVHAVETPPTDRSTMMPCPILASRVDDATVVGTLALCVSTPSVATCPLLVVSP
ncbi:hypothetical protein SPRG_12676 [Saprolegnia parasitica CBS 223.65]|uniref:Dynein heavy chain linker domain-containing protein n=1 Tax=Saprolegnia parasitica (strain CBS 223.65) TaxID=695850 RepID=A0A067BZD9_SAPPC|nr:hypothetical protein SPRG_12676 [Saprolegnia parasitica CBS 223.65]KDO22180.1 hypothetical protein SPRG_12676 [Saprolegnia parasitica CBS 223.65]|eukprot:XP_012207118.1 hypothetical protein SPRG_12676 [Saprolegnia parasitica CBS 223.65]